MNKTTLAAALAAALLSNLTGCVKERVLVTVNGEPGAETKLRTQTISTQIPKDANVMTRQAEKSLIAELKRGGFKYTPTGGVVTMNVNLQHGGYGVGKIATFGPVFSNYGAWNTYQEKTDILELDLTASEKGVPFWEGRVSGSGEYVNGESQQGCIQELFNHIDENFTGEERCE